MTLHGICLDKIRFDATFFKKQHKLTWKNVSSAIKHELYSEISSAIMVIVNKETYENVSSQNANNMLSALKQYRNIHANERKYISNLIKRAEYFDPKQPSTYYKYYSSVQQYTFLDNTHFWTHLSNGNELIFCNQYFMNEEYDSDAFLEDVKAQNLVHESNVCIEIGKITADAWKFISWIAQHATFLYQFGKCILLTIFKFGDRIVSTKTYPFRNIFKLYNRLYEQSANQIIYRIFTR
eukprot:277809_1